MAQQTAKRQQAQQEPYAQLRRRDVFLHFVKTFRLIGSLLGDGRVPAIRKVFFVGVLLAFLALLVFPDLLSETVLSVVLPVVGTVLGVPLDAGFDWLAFAFAVIGLLRVFPPEIVAEHYTSLFKEQV